MESLDDAFYGNTEACEEIQNWIDINNWDGISTPGNDELTWTYGDDVTLICNGDMYDDTQLQSPLRNMTTLKRWIPTQTILLTRGVYLVLSRFYDCYSFNVATIINRRTSILMVNNLIGIVLNKRLTILTTVY